MAFALKRRKSMRQNICRKCFWHRPRRTSWMKAASCMAAADARRFSSAATSRCAFAARAETATPKRIIPPPSCRSKRITWVMGSCCLRTTFKLAWWIMRGGTAHCHPGGFFRFCGAQPAQVILQTAKKPAGHMSEFCFHLWGKSLLRFFADRFFCGAGRGAQRDGGWILFQRPSAIFYILSISSMFSRAAATTLPRFVFGGAGKKESRLLCSLCNFMVTHLSVGGGGLCCVCMIE